MDDKDRSVLHHIRIADLIEKDYISLKATDTIQSCRTSIVHASKNIFPVLDEYQKLIGIVQSEQLLQLFLDNKQTELQREMKALAQPSLITANIYSDIYELMQQMEAKNLRILPVVDATDRFLGFVTKNAIFNRYREELRAQLQFGK